MLDASSRPYYRRPGLEPGPILRGSHCLQKVSNVSALTDGPRRMGPGSAFAALTCPGRRKLFSRRIAPELCWKLPALSNRGRREDRVRAAPAVSCAMCTEKCAHEHTGPAENTRPSLRNGFTAYSVISPVSHVLLPPSTPTSGRQNHTPLPYASATFVFATSASIATRPTSVTTADAL